MMDFVKHECGIAMVRLLKSADHYYERYGDLYFGLHLLERILVREYNRGQDGAGLATINIDARLQNNRAYCMKREGTSAIEKIEEQINKEILFEKEWGSDRMPFYGNLMMGHVRYSTTGRMGEEYLHPFRYTNKRNGEELFICGNFHLINSDKLAAELNDHGVKIDSGRDTLVLLHRIARELWDNKVGINDIEKVLQKEAPQWDGGFVICGMDTYGEWWAVRDSHGIRPAYWYADEEKVIVASEKSTIVSCGGIDTEEVHPLKPGVMIRVDRNGKISFRRVIEEKPVRECVFERIYFSRADGGEITLEREKLGYLLSKRIKEEFNIKGSGCLFSFVPASARSAFMGMVAYFSDLSLPVTPQMLAGNSENKNQIHVLQNRFGDKIHFGRTIEKGKALRTFISTEKGREELVEKTYNMVIDHLPPSVDRIVIVDDSIVRGTTLKSSVLTLLDSLNPKEIIVVSCAPQVRYPDFYGIDMSRLGELVAFRSAIDLINKTGEIDIIEEIYEQCRKSLAGEQRTKNFVRLIYSKFSGKEISDEIARKITPDNCKAQIRVVFLWPEDLREAVPGHTGDWCFSGNYPTSGAYNKICQAFVNWYEGNNVR